MLIFQPGDSSWKVEAGRLIWKQIVCVSDSAVSYSYSHEPPDCSPPGSSVHGILQAKILEWVSISFSRGSSRPRHQTSVSCIAGRFFTIWATREGRCLISLWETGNSAPVMATTKKRPTLKTLWRSCPCSTNRQSWKKKKSKKASKVSGSGDLNDNTGPNGKDQRGADFKVKMAGSILDTEVSGSS